MKSGLTQLHHFRHSGIISALKRMKEGKKERKKGRKKERGSEGGGREREKIERKEAKRKSPEQTLQWFLCAVRRACSVVASV